MRLPGFLRPTAEARPSEATAPATPATRPPATRPNRTGGVVPARTTRLLLYLVTFLLVSAVVWLVTWVAMRLALLTLSLLVALLLAALCTPAARWLSRHHLPSWLAAVLALVVVVGIPVGTGLLVWRRVSGQIQELRSALTAGVDDIRRWLTEEPLSLDASQVDDVRDQVIAQLQEATPSAVVGAMTVLQILTATALVLFTLFFLIKDGDYLWRSIVGAVPARHRERTDGAGRAAWSTLSSYTQGIIVVASIDAIGIGVALFLLDVPLYLSLTLLTFLAVFVPIVGAIVSGVIAVMVTLVTNGATDAVIIAVVVVTVQQLEGNVLHPLIVGRAVSLHPLVVIVAITVGTLLVGVVGALVAVPITAVCWSVARHLWQTQQAPPGAAPRASG